MGANTGRYLTIAIFSLTILLTTLLIPSSSLNNIAQADSTLRVDDTKVQLIWEDNRLYLE